MGHVLFQSIVEEVKSYTQLIVGHVLFTNCGSCFVSEYRRGGEVLHTADVGAADSAAAHEPSASGLFTRHRLPPPHGGLQRTGTQDQVPAGEQVDALVFRRGSYTDLQHNDSRVVLGLLGRWREQFVRDDCLRGGSVESLQGRNQGSC